MATPVKAAAAAQQKVDELDCRASDASKTRRKSLALASMSRSLRSIAGVAAPRRAKTGGAGLFGVKRIAEAVFAAKQGLVVFTESKGDGDGSEGSEDESGGELPESGENRNSDGRGSGTGAGTYPAMNSPRSPNSPRSSTWKIAPSDRSGMFGEGGAVETALHKRVARKLQDAARKAVYMEREKTGGTGGEAQQESSDQTDALASLFKRDPETWNEMELRLLSDVSWDSR